MGGMTTQPMEGQGAPQDMSQQAQQANAQQAYPMQQGQGQPQGKNQVGFNAVASETAPQNMSQQQGYGQPMGMGQQLANLMQQSYGQQGGAGKGSVNPGAQGNYSPPPGAPPGMMSREDHLREGMAEFNKQQGMPGGTVPYNKSGLPEGISQFLQQNSPAMGAVQQFNPQSLMLNQSGGQGNIPIQAGARAPVAFGAPNPMGAPMLAEKVQAPPPPPPPENNYNDYMNNGRYGGGYGGGYDFKDGGSVPSQDARSVIQNALRLLSNRN